MRELQKRVRDLESENKTLRDYVNIMNKRGEQ